MTKRAMSIRIQALVAAATLIGTGCQASSDDGGAGSGASTAGTTALVSGNGPGSYCDVQSIVHARCISCHGTALQAGAPMAMLAHADLIAPAKTMANVTVAQLMAIRVRDDQKPMPPFGTRLTEDEMSRIDAFVAAGMPAPSDPTCSTGGAAGSGFAGEGAAAGSGTVVDTAGTMALTAGVGAGTGVEAGTSGGTAGSVAGDDWPEDCDEKYLMVAHGQSTPGDTTPFDVSARGNSEFYQCFFFKAPWGADEVHAVKFRPVIDDERVVHHWILYGNDTGMSGSDGQVGGSGCSSGAFLSGWAPGGDGGEDLPSDVGLQMPVGAGAEMGLEIHYNNAAGHTDSLDKSGVEFCVTKTPRTNTAAVHWLGSTSIVLQAHKETVVTGNCTPNITTPVHLLAHSPHMHRLGTHATLVLNRAGGAKEMLHNAVFNFADQKQVSLSPEVIVNAGDTLTTTCTFDNTTDATVTFGEDTGNEMCFNFVVAWPAGVLTSSGGGFFGGGAGANRCMN